MRNKNVINRLNSTGKVLYKKKYHRKKIIEFLLCYNKDIMEKIIKINESRMAINNILNHIKNESLKKQ